MNIRLSKYLHRLVILLFVLANASFVGAVVDEIVDHTITQSSDNYVDHFSLLEDIDFDADIDLHEIDEPNISSQSGRRFESQQSILKFSDFSFFEIFELPTLAVKMRIKVISFIDRILVKTRLEYFSIHRMNPF